MIEIMKDYSNLCGCITPSFRGDIATLNSNILRGHKQGNNFVPDENI